MKFLYIFILLFSANIINANNQDKTYVFNCNKELNFVANIGGGEAWLFMPQKTLNYKAQDSKKCDKFVDGDDFIGIKGQVAFVKIGEQTYHCTNNPKEAVFESAKLRGFDFMALGNEPGWTLLIKGNEIFYNGDYGSNYHRFKNAIMMTNQEKRFSIFKAKKDSHAITLKLEGKKCNDTMNDDTFETTVSIELDSKTLNGCGKSLH